MIQEKEEFEGGSMRIISDRFMASGFIILGLLLYWLSYVQESLL